jgi:hypothetical protein
MKAEKTDEMMKSIRTCRAFDGYKRKGSKMAIQGVATGAKCGADADNSARE